VFQGSERSTGCQFTFTCDGSLTRHRFAADRYVAWRAVAESVLDGIAPRQVFGATHYHADYVSPYWAPSLVRVAQISRHIFYRQPFGSDAAILPGYAAGQVPVSVNLPAELSRTAVVTVPANLPAPKPTAPPPVFAPWGLLPTAP
jgi:Cell Wall Hydrolase